MIASEPNHVLYFLGLTSALKATLFYLWRNRKPVDAEYVGRVGALRLHPIKSGSGVEVESLDCDVVEGPHHGDITDRHWALTTSDYTLVNYKQETSFALFKPLVSGGQLSITYPEVEPISVNILDVTENGKPVTVSAYGTTVRGIDCGAVPCEWLGRIYPGKGYRLIYCPPRFNSTRIVRTGNKNHEAWLKNAKDTDVIAYQSVTPYHVMTQEALDDLNTRLTEKVGIERFRPNIVIWGAKAYDEDTWRGMYIGDVSFSTTKLTGRCTFLNINPDSGEVSEEPYQTLNGYRKLVPEFGPVMGIHMVLERPGLVRVGDPVYITRGNNTIKP